ncbi:Collagen-like protein 6, partial [Bienertia sinuspersici]
MRFCMESQSSVNNVRCLTLKWNFDKLGPKLDLTTLKKKEMEEKLNFAALGLFRDFREFSAEEVQAWVSLKWLTREPIEVEKASRNTFIFYCKSGEDRDKLLALSTTCYKGALIIFKRWIPNSSLRDHDFSWGSIWVKIEGLPLHINQIHAASSLLERFGSVIYFDGKLNTEGPQKVIRARMRIPLRGALIPGTLGNKNTSVDLVLPTHGFRPENSSDSSDSSEEEEAEEKGENTDDQESGDSDGKGDDGDDGDPGPSKKRP